MNEGIEALKSLKLQYEDQIRGWRELIARSEEEAIRGGWIERWGINITEATVKVEKLMNQIDILASAEVEIKRRPRGPQTLNQNLATGIGTYNDNKC